MSVDPKVVGRGTLTGGVPATSAAAAPTAVSGSARVRLLSPIGEGPHFPSDPPTALVGRKVELALVEDLLAGGQQVITLTGPPGIGKTRLALSIASSMQPAYAGRHGVCVCLLEEARTADDAVGTIAGALGVKGGALAGSLLDHVTNALARRAPVLLVLDNAEQVVQPVAGAVARFRDASPYVQVLVTSRERLRLSGERVVELPPLAADGDRSDALALWIARVRDLRPDYDVTPERDAVLELLHRLEGVPLAIELAAARRTIVDARAMLARMERPLELLSRGAHDVPPRQRTLRAAIEWSWNLLSAAERAALARCALLGSSFLVETACAVIDPGSAGALDLLQSLREKSLLQSTSADPELPSRLRMAASVRELAMERLDMEARAGGERLHAAFLATLAARLSADVLGPRGLRARRMLRAELEALMSVAERYAEGADLPAVHVAQILSGLAEAIHVSTGPRARLLSLFARIEPRLDMADLDAGERALVLYARGRTLLSAGELVEAERALEEAARLAGDAGETRLAALALRRLGDTRVERGALGEAAVALGHAAGLARELGDRCVEGMVLGSQAILAQERGDTERAQALLARSLRLSRAADNEEFAGIALANLAHTRAERGEHDAARAGYAEARTSFQRLGVQAMESFVVGSLGIVEHDAGRTQLAQQLYDEAVERCVLSGDRRFEGVFLGYRGLLEAETGALDDAALTLLEAADLLQQAGDHRYAAVFTLAAEAVGGAEQAGALRGPRPAGDAGEDPIDVVVELLRSLRSLTAGAPRAREAARALCESPRVEAAAAGSSDVRIALRLLAAWLRAPGSLPTRLTQAPALTVGPDVAWVRPPGRGVIPLDRRPLLRRLMTHLIDRRRASPGAGIAVEELVEAGWPDERMHPHSAASRVYVALSTLRKLGLADVILRDEHGYRLDPNVPLS